MRMRVLAAGAAAAVLIPALAACGSDDTSSKAAPTSVVTTPVTTAAVTDGLNSMVALAKQISAADGSAGKKLAEGLEGFWKPIEDSIKAKDADTYTSVEDAMAELESGDVAKAKQGSADLEAAVKAYLAK